eukprot:g3297.t1
MCCGGCWLAVVSLARGAEASAVVPFIHVQGAGASFPYQLYTDAIFAYQLAGTPGAEAVSLSYTSLGSGRGKCRMGGNATHNRCTPDDTAPPRFPSFAGSDYTLVDVDYERDGDIQMYPTVAGAVVPIYNLPLLGNASAGNASAELVLGRETLARLFRGNVTAWDDPSIVRNNPRLHASGALARAARLHGPIVVCVRSDKSGTTHIWKAGLSSFDATFRAQVGTSPRDAGWPARFERRATNQGVAAFVSQHPGSLGYSVLADARHLGLSVAAIRATPVAGVGSCGEAAAGAAAAGAGTGSSSGESGAPVVRASPESVAAAVAERVSSIHVRRLTASLHGAQGLNSWPIVGFTYIVTRTRTLRGTESCAERRELVRFWRWFMTSAVVHQLAVKLHGFAMLPPELSALVTRRLEQDTTCPVPATAAAATTVPAVGAAGALALPPPLPQPPTEIMGSPLVQHAMELFVMLYQDTLDMWNQHASQLPHAAHAGSQHEPFMLHAPAPVRYSRRFEHLPAAEVLARLRSRVIWAAALPYRSDTPYSVVRTTSDRTAAGAALADPSAFVTVPFSVTAFEIIFNRAHGTAQLARAMREPAMPVVANASQLARLRTKKND